MSRKVNSPRKVIVSTVEKKGAKKRTNGNAILAEPVKHAGDLPVKKSGGRKSKLAPIVEKLKNDPDQWYRVANGLKGTVSQTRVRMMKLDANLEVETRAIDDKHADCFARYNTPAK